MAEKEQDKTFHEVFGIDTSDVPEVIIKHLKDTLEEKLKIRKLYDGLDTDISDIPEDIINIVKNKGGIGVYYSLTISGMTGHGLYVNVDGERKKTSESLSEFSYCDSEKEKISRYHNRVYFAEKNIYHVTPAKDRAGRPYANIIVFNFGKEEKEDMRIFTKYIKNNPEKAHKLFYTLPIKLALEDEKITLVKPYDFIRGKGHPEIYGIDGPKIYDLITVIAAISKQEGWDYSAKVQFLRTESK